jgi:RecA-family ATPase
MALEMCLGVAGDHHVLGGFRPDLGDVLYCALEDTPRRLQRRIRKLNYGIWPERLTLATKWRRLDDGGTKDIGQWAKSVVCPRLVVMDTLARVRPERSPKDTTYDGDYKAAEELHRIANEVGLAVLMLHHTRKAEAADLRHPRPCRLRRYRSHPPARPSGHHPLHARSRH